MAATDTTPPQFIDLRTISSDYRFNCVTHGNVNGVLIFNGDLARAICADCLETAMGGLGKKITFIQGFGPPLVTTKVL